MAVRLKEGYTLTEAQLLSQDHHVTLAQPQLALAGF